MENINTRPINIEDVKKSIKQLYIIQKKLQGDKKFYTQVLNTTRTIRDLKTHVSWTNNSQIKDVIRVIYIYHRAFEINLPVPKNKRYWEIFKLMFREHFKEEVNCVDKRLYNLKKELKELQRIVSKKDQEKASSKPLLEKTSAQNIHNFVWNWIEHQLENKDPLERNDIEKWMRETYQYLFDKRKISKQQFDFLNKHKSIMCGLYKGAEGCTNCPLYLLRSSGCWMDPYSHNSILPLEAMFRLQSKEENIVLARIIKNMEIGVGNIPNKEVVRKVFDV